MSDMSDKSNASVTIDNLLSGALAEARKASVVDANAYYELAMQDASATLAERLAEASNTKLELDATNITISAWLAATLGALVTVAVADKRVTTRHFEMLMSMQVAQAMEMFEAARKGRK